MEFRNNHILILRDAGWTIPSIARKYGISKQRVHQIIYRDEWNAARRLSRIASSKRRC